VSVQKHKCVVHQVKCYLLAEKGHKWEVGSSGWLAWCRCLDVLWGTWPILVLKTSLLPINFQGMSLCLPKSVFVDLGNSQPDVFIGTSSYSNVRPKHKAGNTTQFSLYNAL